MPYGYARDNWYTELNEEQKTELEPVYERWLDLSENERKNMKLDCLTLDDISPIAPYKSIDPLTDLSW